MGYNGAVDESSDRERIENLEEAGRVQNDRLDHLEDAGLIVDEWMLALAKEIDGLQGKLENRAVIEQAKGVIMSTMGCGPGGSVRCTRRAVAGSELQGQ
jgi:hypothetical protein